MAENPTKPHNQSIEAWVAWYRATMVKTLIDQFGNEPNPAGAARLLLTDIATQQDTSTAPAIVAALNAATSLTPAEQ